MECVERLDGVERRIGIFSLDVEVVLHVDETSADDFHQQGSVSKTEIGSLKVSFGDFGNSELNTSLLRCLLSAASHLY